MVFKATWPSHAWLKHQIPFIQHNITTPTSPPRKKKAYPCLHRKCIWPCQGRFSAKAANPLAWVLYYIYNMCVSESSNVPRVQEWLKGPRKFDLLFMNLVLTGCPLSGKKLCRLQNPQWLRQWTELTSCVSPKARYEIKDQSPSCSDISRAVNTGVLISP